MSTAVNPINIYTNKWNLEQEFKQHLNGDDGSFYTCNLSDVIKKYNMWLEKLPRVKPHYAVKCNDDVEVLRALASVGCSFDCASAGEIKKILELDVAPERIIFANTTKPVKHMQYAKECNVNLLTFDNVDEAYKILEIVPQAEIILRIRYSSQTAKYKLGKKFGCDPFSEAPDLLKLAKKLQLNIVGISFHIGSSCEDYESYCQAIEVARQVFDVATEIGFMIRILDIGGGFPGDSFERINEFAGMINQSLEEHFPLECFQNLKIFSEPGRYFVESAFTLIAQIHSRKITKDQAGEIFDVMYYITEGVYSNFLFIPLGPEVKDPNVLAEKRSDIKYKSTIWGPTCDSTDKVCDDIDLELLEINDVVYFLNMGAYTIPLRTTFNGFEQTKVVYFINENDCEHNSSGSEMELDGKVNRDLNNKLNKN